MRSTCRSVVGVADRLPCATRVVLRCLVGCAACGGDASAPPPRAAAIHPLRPVPVASAPAAAAPASAAPLSETSASATPAASASPRYTGPSHLPDLPPANLVGPCVPEKPISIGTSDAPWNEDPSPTIAATTTGMMVVWESKRGKTLRALGCASKDDRLRSIRSASTIARRWAALGEDVEVDPCEDASI